MFAYPQFKASSRKLVGTRDIYIPCVETGFSNVLSAASNLVDVAISKPPRPDRYGRMVRRQVNGVRAVLMLATSKADPEVLVACQGGLLAFQKNASRLVKLWAVRYMMDLKVDLVTDIQWEPMTQQFSEIRSRLLALGTMGGLDLQLVDQDFLDALDDKIAQCEAEEK